MRRHHVIALFAAAWGVTATAFLVWSLVRHIQDRTVDASFAVVAVFPLFAFAAAVAELRERRRLAGVLLIVSAGAVMGFAYLGSVLAFAVGVAEIVTGGRRARAA